MLNINPISDVDYKKWSDPVHNIFHDNPVTKCPNLKLTRDSFSKNKVIISNNKKISFGDTGFVLKKNKKRMNSTTSFMFSDLKTHN